MSAVGEAEDVGSVDVAVGMERGTWSVGVVVPADSSCLGLDTEYLTTLSVFFSSSASSHPSEMAALGSRLLMLPTGGREGRRLIPFQLGGGGVPPAVLVQLFVLVSQASSRKCVES